MPLYFPWQDRGYVAISDDGALTNERVLTGTSNQITVTDNGAGASVVLSSPQNLHTGATPQFTKLALNTPVTAETQLYVWRSNTNAPTSIDSIGFMAGRQKGTATVSQRLIGVHGYMQDHPDVANKTITGATNASPIVITATAHGFANGDKIAVYGVGGNTAANGAWTVANATTNTFELSGSTGNGAYTSGGTATNRPMLYGVMASVLPTVARGGLTGTAANGDDVNGFVTHNGGTAKATDAIYISQDPGIVGSGWASIVTVQASGDIGMQFLGTYGDALFRTTSATITTNVAIDLGSGHSIRLNGGSIHPSADSATAIQFREADNATVVMNIDTTNDRVGIGTAATAPATIVDVITEASSAIRFNNYQGNTTGANHQLRKARGTAASPLRVQSGDTLGGINGFGAHAADDVSAASFGAVAAQFKFVAGESFTSTARGTVCAIGTQPLGSVTVADRVLVGCNKVLTDNSAITILNVNNSNGSAAGGYIEYTIEVQDGTDYQVETGRVSYRVLNKAGVVTAAITEIASEQSLGAGTLTTTWAISNANPAAVSINANTSLTPSAGFPRIMFTTQNLGYQSVALA